MNSFALAFREFKFDQKSFWRDPQTVFFTVGLPGCTCSSSPPSSATRKASCPGRMGR